MNISMIQLHRIFCISVFIFCQALLSRHPGLDCTLGSNSLLYVYLLCRWTKLLLSGFHKECLESLKIEGKSEIQGLLEES